MTMFNQNFQLVGGNSRNIVVTVTNEMAQPVDLTNLVIVFVLKDHALSVTKLLTKDNADIGGVELSDAENGKFVVRLFPADSINLGGNYYYDIEIKDGINIWTVSIGNINIVRNVIEVN